MSLRETAVSWLVWLAGWITIIFILPNVVLWTTVAWFSQPKTIQYVAEKHPPRATQAAVGTAMLEEVKPTESASFAYLCEIKSQATISQLTDLDHLTYLELQYRRDRLNAMLYYLNHDGRDTVDATELELLRERLEAQRVMVSEYLKLRQNRDYQEFAHFRARVADLRKHRALTL